MSTTSVSSRSRLTAKQEAFCIHYFQTRHATNSAIAAGYKPSTAQEISSENLSKPMIQARLRELEAKTESDAVADVSERKKRLTTFLRANLVDFLDSDGNPAVTADIQGHQAVSEYEVSRRMDSEGGVSTRKRIKLRDPIAAIQELNKMERIGAENTLPQNINVIFVVGKGYREVTD